MQVMSYFCCAMVTTTASFQSLCGDILVSLVYLVLPGLPLVPPHASQGVERISLGRDDRCLSLGEKTLGQERSGFLSQACLVVGFSPASGEQTVLPRPC